VEQALTDALFEAPKSISDVLEIDRATRSRVEALMKDACH
jgi:hypothetical protein